MLVEVLHEFQFNSCAIKGRSVLQVAEGMLTNFNSTLVRLKAPNPVSLLQLAIFQFNSCAIKGSGYQKVVFESIIFQFNSCAIKGSLPVCCAGPIANFNSTLVRLKDTSHNYLKELVSFSIQILCD